MIPFTLYFSRWSTSRLAHPPAGTNNVLLDFGLTQSLLVSILSLSFKQDKVLWCLCNKKFN